MIEKEMILTEEELEKFAQSFAQLLQGNETIFLIGDLGTGKTTFVKYLVKYLEPTESHIRVSSPTFTIVNVYPTKKGNVFHADLYRVKDFDFTDFEGKGILIIEWPDLMNNPPRPDWILKFDYIDEDKRKLSITKVT